LIAHFRGARPSLLLVDSGNVFDADISLARARLLAHAYDVCGYDAVALGAADVMFLRKKGADVFQKLGLPWVCTNQAVDLSTLGIARYRILKRGAVTVAVAALLEPRLLSPRVLENGSPPLRLSEPIGAIRSLAGRLKNEADLLCVLAHMRRGQAEQIAAQVAGVDLLVLGHDEVLLETQARTADRPIVEAGKWGQYLGVTEWRRSPPGIAAWQLRHVPLEAAVPNHPDLWRAYLDLEREAPESATAGASLPSSPPEAGARPSLATKLTLRVLVFLAPGCSSCDAIRPENLHRLAAHIGCAVEPEYFYLDEGSAYERLVRLEREYGDEGNELPVVFVGSEVLGGPKEITERLGEALRRQARAGVPGENPQVRVTPPSQETVERARPSAPIHMAYFDEPGCPHCRRVKYAIDRLSRAWPALAVRVFDVSDPANRLLQGGLGERLGVHPEKRLLTPAVFVGQDTLVQSEISDERLEALLEKYAPMGAPPLWKTDLDLLQVQRHLEGRFTTIGIAGVVLGGLVDGINPCAFATLILFISLLRSVGPAPHRIWAVGASFTGGVFVTYLAIGLGLTEVVRWADRFPSVRATVTWGIAGLCGILAVLSFCDALRAARGRLGEMTLQLPRRLKRLIQWVLVRFRRSAHLVIAGFIAGAVVSAVELPCTGQVYLRLVKVMVATSGGHRLRAFLLLVAYNMCFIVPQGIVLAAVCGGTTSQRLTRWFRGHAVFVKLVLGTFFLFLLGLLIALMLRESRL